MMKRLDALYAWLVARSSGAVLVYLALLILLFAGLLFRMREVILNESSFEVAGSLSFKAEAEGVEGQITASEPVEEKSAAPCLEFEAGSKQNLQRSPCESLVRHAALGPETTSVPVTAVRVLDGRWRYSAAEVDTLFSALGEQGKKQYAFSQLFLDLAFPAIYTAFFLLLWVTVAGELRWRAAFLVAPLTILIADLLENTFIVAMLWGSPITTWVGIASAMTKLKFAALALTVLGLDLVGGCWACTRMAKAVPSAGRGWSTLCARGGYLVSGFVEMAKRWVPNLILIRVQLIAASLMLALPVLPLVLEKSFGLIDNLFLLDNRVELAMLVFLSVTAVNLVGLTTLITLENANARFAVDKIALPTALGGRELGRTLWFTPLALPLVTVAALRSMGAANGQLEVIDVWLGLILGVVLFAVMALVVYWIRPHLVSRLDLLLEARLGAWLPATLQESSLAGYVQQGRNGVLSIKPGHGLAVAAFLVLSVLYFIGYNISAPTSDSILRSFTPTVGYLVLLVMFIGVILSGTAFFFDRWRVPVVLVVAVYMTLLNVMWPRDHVFEASKGLEAPAPALAASKRHAFASRPAGQQLLKGDHVEVETLSQDEQSRAQGQGEADGKQAGVPGEGTAAESQASTPNVLTVVALSGGATQASAWSVEVLTGLQEVLGQEFADSIHLISSVSGGSVGAYFYLEAFSETSAPPQQRLDAIRHAAAASSLEEVAWGFAYPDLMRAFSPWRPPERLDRAWAMEQAWLRSADVMREKLELPLRAAATRLSNWAVAAEEGTLPAVIFNATFAETAFQFPASNLDLCDACVDQRVEDPTGERHFGTRLDMPAVTAARLSATFPWATPMARPDARSVDEERGYHIADGGYFDNFGIYQAIRWIDKVMKESSDDYDTILFLEVSAFPSGGLEKAKENSGWGYSTYGPLKLILGVRTSTQRARMDLELDLLKQRSDWGGKIKHFELRPEPRQGVPGRPLSWRLSPTDKRQVCLDWLGEKEDVVSIADIFGVPAAQVDAAWPKSGRCNDRLKWER